MSTFRDVPDKVVQHKDGELFQCQTYCATCEQPAQPSSKSEANWEHVMLEKTNNETQDESFRNTMNTIKILASVNS